MQLKKLFSPQSKLLRFLGWTGIYIVVFYLGNLSGEFVAAKLPVVSFTVPSFMTSIHLPDVHISWNGLPMRQKSSSQKQQNTGNTVIVGGNVITIPGAGATKEEQDVYLKSVATVAVAASSIKLSASCDIEPAVVRVQADTLTVVNGSGDVHDVMIGTSSEKVNGAGTISVPVQKNTNPQPISCDGTIVGFYITP